MTFTVRPAIDDQEDRNFILSLNSRLAEVIDAPTHSTSEVIAFQDRFTATAWDESVTANTTLIAIAEDGERLGYINLRETDDEMTQGKCGYIALLAVTRAAEGTGVGQFLMQQAEVWAKQMGFERLCLDVFASNLRGRHFYEKMGYAPETMRITKRV
ncbi:GNAT family N-acetyltransferase [Parvularcula marina]|uniref:GNAT family N-acetyltransferase n=1 Tax=Parvularcula marina TaxID=2292771 RepID=A0A371RF74_9PROT|nr:GNAT family N-acetyltransferase [Parvularcula marina]RFB04092.1 GNAT family N-acetyltransferase [Parvularcula marina]